MYYIRYVELVVIIAGLYIIIIGRGKPKQDEVPVGNVIYKTGNFNIEKATSKPSHQNNKQEKPRISRKSSIQAIDSKIDFEEAGKGREYLGHGEDRGVDRKKGVKADIEINIGNLVNRKSSCSLVRSSRGIGIDSGEFSPTVLHARPPRERMEIGSPTGPRTTRGYTLLGDRLAGHTTMSTTYHTTQISRKSRKTTKGSHILQGNSMRGEASGEVFLGVREIEVEEGARCIKKSNAYAHKTYSPMSPRSFHLLHPHPHTLHTLSHSQHTTSHQYMPTASRKGRPTCLPICSLSPSLTQNFGIHILPNPTPNLLPNSKINKNTKEKHIYQEFKKYINLPVLYQGFASTKPDISQIIRYCSNN